MIFVKSCHRWLLCLRSQRDFLGSARVSRAGERVLAIANFFNGFHCLTASEVERKFVLARRQNQTRETRALPGGSRCRSC